MEVTVDIQGLIALAPQERTKAIYITWMCTNPQNNSLLTKDIKYYGVGGHLFAIAAKKSLDYGYDGYIYGFADNEHLLNHYAEKEGKKVIELTEIEKKRVITR